MMGNWMDREPGWRRQEEDRFRRRSGALDSDYEYYPDNEQRSEKVQDDWRQPGPFTGVGPRNYHRSDETIHEDVCRRLTQHGEIDASEIDIEVKDGEVTLQGKVADRRMKRLAEANVDRIRGVIDVHNRLRLKNPPKKEDLEKEQEARRMAEEFPGGPTPTGPAGY
jgi:hypothetical protein